MTVREYIGARYVPLYIGEWSDQNAYEPLSIVTYQGNSYTSRQAVPVGIPITNEGYWVLTANYNAQIEQYRQEVLAFDGRITENSERFGLSYVGLYGAEENDPNVDWQSIVNQISEVSDNIDFGNGQWDLGEGITLPTNIQTVSGRGAKLYTSSTNVIDHLIEVPSSAKTFILFNGLRFVGNAVVHKLLSVKSANRATITSCMFMNVGSGNYGVYNDQHGLQISGCSFDNRVTDNPDYDGGVAIHTTTDSFVTGCKIFLFDCCIEANGANIDNCYFFSKGATDGICLRPSKYLESKTNRTSDIVFTNCEFDCMQKTVINPLNVVIESCIFYWNDHNDIENDCAIFWNADGVTNFSSIVFNSNVFKLQTISYYVRTFQSESFERGVNAAINLVKYYSQGNVVTPGVYASTTRDHYLITAGWNADHARSSTVRTFYNRIVKDPLNNSTTSPVYQLIGYGFTWIYRRDGNNRDLFFLTDTTVPDASIITNKCWYKTGNTNVDEYISFSSVSQLIVEVTGGPAFNMSLEVYASDAGNAPDVSAYTVKTAKKISLATV